MKYEKSRRPALEVLEDRLAPAGNVLVAVEAGSLTIQGDALGNEISIDQKGLPAGEFRVLSGFDPTTINGREGPLVFTGVTRDLLITMNEGRDLIDLAGCAVPRNVKIDCGSGDSYLTLVSSVVGGQLLINNGDGFDTLSVGALSVGGRAQIDNGGGGSQVQFFTENVIGADLSIKSRAGFDRVVVGGAVVSGSVRIDTGEGGLDEFGEFVGSTIAIGSFTTTRVRDDVVVNNGSGLDRFSISRNSLVGGDVRIDNGNGDAIPILGSFTRIVQGSRICGDVIIRSKAGLDIFQLNDASISGDVILDNGNGGRFIGDAGEEVIKGSDVFIGYPSPAVIGGDLRITNRNGLDKCTLVDLSLGGDLRIENGDGATITEVGLSVGTCVVGGDVRIENGNGFDSLAYVGGAIHGKVDVANGAGGSFAEMVRVNITGPLTISTGKGADEIRLNGVVVAGATQIRTGADQDSVTVSGSTFRSRVRLDGGAGSDSFLGDGGNSFMAGLNLDGFEV